MEMRWRQVATVFSLRFWASETSNSPKILSQQRQALARVSLADKPAIDKSRVTARPEVARSWRIAQRRHAKPLAATSGFSAVAFRLPP